jgi:hypothetical protein
MIVLPKIDVVLHEESLIKAALSIFLNEAASILLITGTPLIYVAQVKVLGG